MQYDAHAAPPNFLMAERICSMVRIVVFRSGGFARAMVHLECFVRASDVMHGKPVQLRATAMDTVSVNQFRENLKSLVEQAISKHEPLRVTRRSGEDFVVLGARERTSPTK